MSAFLAPIHSWLFNKIILAQELEQNIVNLHVQKFGNEAEIIKNESEELYGKYIENKPLEDIIDVNNIHGWLQGRIKEVESRTAYIVTKYFEIYKEESKEITKNAYVKQAKVCASKEDNKINSPENVYMSLNNYILSGMPCDRVNSISEKNDDYIVYTQTGCIHKANYELGKGNLDYLYELRELWIKTFVESLAINYTYEVTKQDDTTISKIIKG